ncbi:MAG: hypothetical protein HYV26_21920 [Candidatus Hydrogenedentes bacterium]|nr:hypothetical protein [Candidatus Hydrogenedentota bacterium]
MTPPQTHNRRAGAQSNFDGIHNGRGDAARHAYWNAISASEFDAATAIEASTAHEYSGLDANAHNEIAMDMNNNAIGAGLAAATREQMQQHVTAALAAGTLLVLDEIDNPNGSGLLKPANE